MDAVKFTLKGNFAFFKKPDVNSYLYFTYGNIHKIALLGIFGAILGYSGYNQMSFKNKYEKIDNEYPEFYEKLKNINISIVPKEVTFAKKVQAYNNSVGYASQERGGNLIVNEQWLENPCWDIYIAIDCEEAKNISKAILQNKYVYIPYLGKNDHLANIDEVKLYENICAVEKADRVDSLFIKEKFTISEKMPKKKSIYRYEEFLPYSLDSLTNKYEYKAFVYTNVLLTNLNTLVYKVDDKNITFF